MRVAGRSLSRLDEEALADYRAKQLALIFQTGNLWPALSARENVLVSLRLAAHDASAADEALAHFGLGARGAHRAGALSGCNQQKLVAAREVARDPKVLIAAQPTRGLDVGAIEYLHRRLVEERDEGRAILLVSLELDEVLSLSDRILVMYEGRVVAEHASGATEEEIGIEMLGGRRKEPSAAVETG